MERVGLHGHPLIGKHQNPYTEAPESYCQQKPGTMFWRHNFLSVLVPIILVCVDSDCWKAPGTFMVRKGVQ